MGEAIYYCKMHFGTEEKAKEALDKVKAFFLEGVEAHDFWQENRKMERGGNQGQFWIKFKGKFPVVYKYLEGAGLADGDCSNRLAGNLDFGDKEDIEENMDVVANRIQYSAEVWHFADWSPIMVFIENEFGALACNWISDEYTEVNWFDLVD